MKARAKLLKFLSDGSARRDALKNAPVGCGQMLVRCDGSRLLTSEVDACIRDGLLRETDRLDLLPEGRTWLARHAARATPDRFARQHQHREAMVLQDGTERRAVIVDRNHSPLSRLAHTKRGEGGAWIDREAYEAGERLARDFEIGALRQRVTSSWDPAPRAGRSEAGGQAELGDAAIDARSRLERARDALGPDLAGVAMDICCFAKGTSQVERERRWPPRSAKLMLRAALALLARHYGLRAGESVRTA